MFMNFNFAIHYTCKIKQTLHASSTTQHFEANKVAFRSKISLVIPRLLNSRSNMMNNIHSHRVPKTLVPLGVAENISPPVWKTLQTFTLHRRQTTRSMLSRNKRIPIQSPSHCTRNVFNTFLQSPKPLPERRVVSAVPHRFSANLLRLFSAHIPQRGPWSTGTLSAIYTCRNLRDMPTPTSSGNSRRQTHRRIDAVHLASSVVVELDEVFASVFAVSATDCVCDDGIWKIVAPKPFPFSLCLAE